MVAAVTPSLTAELFTLPLAGGRYLVYAPLRRAGTPSLISLRRHARAHDGHALPDYRLQPSLHQLPPHAALDPAADDRTAGQRRRVPMVCALWGRPMKTFPQVFSVPLFLGLGEVMRHVSRVRRYPAHGTQKTTWSKAGQAPARYRANAANAWGLPFA